MQKVLASLLDMFHYGVSAAEDDFQLAVRIRAYTFDHLPNRLLVVFDAAGFHLFNGAAKVLLFFLSSSAVLPASSTAFNLSVNVEISSEIALNFSS